MGCEGMMFTGVRRSRRLLTKNRRLWWMFDLVQAWTGNEARHNEAVGSFSSNWAFSRLGVAGKEQTIWSFGLYVSKL